LEIFICQKRHINLKIAAALLQIVSISLRESAARLTKRQANHSLFRKGVVYKTVDQQISPALLFKEGINRVIKQNRQSS